VNEKSYMQVKQDNNFHPERGEMELKNLHIENETHRQYGENNGCIVIPGLIRCHLIYAVLPFCWRDILRLEEEILLKKYKCLRP